MIPPLFLVSLVLLALTSGWVLGCARVDTTGSGPVASTFHPIEAEVNGLWLRLIRLHPDRSGEGVREGTRELVGGWLVGEFQLENRGKQPILLSGVKLLTAGGRYLKPAASYDEVLAPPGAGDHVAGTIATSAAGVAAGQVIPFGGVLVHTISGIARGSNTEARALEEQRFRLSQMLGAELAPGGRMEGSAYFPFVATPQAVVIEVTQGNRVKSTVLSLNPL